MFEITKYNFELTNSGEQEIRIEFKYLGDKPRIIYLKLRNVTLNDFWHVLGGNIPISPSVNYWVSGKLSKPFSVKFNIDTHVEFIDVETSQVLETHYLPNFTVDFKKRSLGSNFSKKNIWVIGDSHISHFFERSIKDEIFHTPNYILNPLGYPNVSVNRFSKKDYLKFLSAYPIMDGDDIIFMWGEIDCRITLIRNAYLKGIPLIQNVEEVILKYVKTLKDIQYHYSKCNIKVVKPLPPIPDNWISKENEKEILYKGSTALDRMKTKILFDSFLSLYLDNNIPILDINHVLSDENGYANTNLLIKGEHHYKFTNLVINTLKEQING